jgi:hypothetical protein
MLINPRIATAGLKTCLACVVLAGAALLWLPMASLAQTGTGEQVEEPDQQSVPGQAESVPEENEPEDTEQEESLTVDVDSTPGRFIPSEEISEDFSVAFPVDI